MPLLTKKLKQKIDGIEYGANNYSLPTANSTTLGGVKVGPNLNIKSDGTLYFDSTNIKSMIIDNPSANYASDTSTTNQDMLYLSKDNVYNNPKKVTLKGSMNTTTSTKTITGCVIGMPLYVLHSNRHADRSWCAIKVISGAKIGTIDPVLVGTIWEDRYLSNCFVTIPTSSNVVFEFNTNDAGIAGDDETVYFYQ